MVQKLTYPFNKIIIYNRQAFYMCFFFRRIRYPISIYAHRHFTNAIHSIIIAAILTYSWKWMVSGPLSCFSNSRILLTHNINKQNGHGHTETENTYVYVTIDWFIKNNSSSMVGKYLHHILGRYFVSSHFMLMFAVALYSMLTFQMWEY